MIKEDNFYHWQWRYAKDVLARCLVVFAGIGVIAVITLIGLYLFYVIVPLFKPASIALVGHYPVPEYSPEERSLFYALEEYHEIGLRITDRGRAIFFRAEDGTTAKDIQLPLAPGVTITAFARGDFSQRMIGLGLSDDTVLLFQHNYQISYSKQDKRIITPSIDFPFGKQAFSLSPERLDIVQLSVQGSDEEASIVAYGARDQNLYLLRLTLEDSPSLDETQALETALYPLYLDAPIVATRLDVNQQNLYTIDTHGDIYHHNISATPRLVQKRKVLEKGEALSLEFLSEGISILVGDSLGMITQWFLVSDQDDNDILMPIRKFDQGAAVVKIVPEYFRKGFMALGEDGSMKLYHATAENLLFSKQFNAQDMLLAFSPYADALITESDQENIEYWHIDNEYPEVSWNALLGKVWYESRDRPEYIWQSSSASNDFEPKFSIVPLIFGTMKAVFYAMLFAIPIAIAGAVYTAHFMSLKMRRIVKPTIEIMEAVPTVILGFVAGLWAAPFIEQHLLGMLFLLLGMPCAIFMASIFWQLLPAKIRHTMIAGYEPMYLFVLLIIVAICAIQLGNLFEDQLFSGNLSVWLTQKFDITYDQRNAIVIAIAMGFAVIPTIFSISEDAIASVPKHLVTSSLALGATQWQTVIRVVLLTASPGIFSAVMIGFGRAVGETMIVIMATGNTPIMDMSIFEGLRALSANIAIEMPESERNSTHYRILFLTGFVLFMMTFFFNTIADVVRQRLRERYSRL